MVKKKQQKGACSDAEFQRTRAQFRAEMKAARADPANADTSWADDLPEGEEFDDSEGSTTVMIVEGRPTRSRRARAGSLPGTAARTGVRRTGGTARPRSR
jgi:hypothetical protein